MGLRAPSARRQPFDFTAGVLAPNVLPAPARGNTAGIKAAHPRGFGGAMDVQARSWLATRLYNKAMKRTLKGASSISAVPFGLNLFGPGDLGGALQRRLSPVRWAAGDR